MILGRLYEKLFEEGVVIVSTSNRPPDDLYKGGLNRDLFVPFIEMIKRDLDVTKLSGGKDYRYQRIKGLQTFYTPVNEKTTDALQIIFHITAQGGTIKSDWQRRPGRPHPRPGKGNFQKCPASLF